MADPGGKKPAPAKAPEKGAKAGGTTAAPAAPDREEAALPRSPSWWGTLRADPPRILGKVLGAACLGLVLLVWFLVTRGDDPQGQDRYFTPVELPSPGEVWDAWEPIPDGAIIDGITATLVRVLKGFLLATVVGVGFGVLAASFRSVAAFLQPLVIFGRSVPIGALLPISFLFFGIDERQKMMFIFVATVPFVFSDTVKAVSLVPERYVETAQTLGATRWQIIRKVLFPLALPDIVTGLRFMFGLALGYIMLAETINVREGLGYLINMGERRGNSGQSYLMLILIAVLAYAFDAFLRYVQRFAFHYRKDL